MTAQTPGGAASAFFSWTVIMLILLGIGAAMVIAGMIYGNRLARRRHRAQAAAEERAEEAGVEPTPAPLAADTEALPELAKERDPADRAAERAAEPKPKPPAKPKPAPKPAAKPEPAVEAPAPAVEPNIAGALALTTIKGLGPKVAAMLAERGITRVDQLAALGDDEASALDAQLGTFTGRMARDRWIDQAKLLASGDTKAYETEFGKLG